jgi:hypothetical protein
MRWNYDTTSVQRIAAFSELVAQNAAASKGGTLIYLSRVGFNEQKSEALFCMESRGTMLFYLRLDHGTWKLVNADVIGLAD